MQHFGEIIEIEFYFNATPYLYHALRHLRQILIFSIFKKNTTPQNGKQISMLY